MLYRIFAVFFAIATSLFALSATAKQPSHNSTTSANSTSTRVTTGSTAVKISKLPPGETKPMGDWGKMIKTNPSGSQHITQTGANAAEGPGAHVTTQQGGRSVRDFFDAEGKYLRTEIEGAKSVAKNIGRTLPEVGAEVGAAAATKLITPVPLIMVNPTTLPWADRILPPNMQQGGSY